MWLQIPEFNLWAINEGTQLYVVAKSGAALFGWRPIDFPKGWVTDYASVPKIFRWLLPQDGPYKTAAVLHDRALNLGWTRHDARELFYEALKEDKQIIGWWRMWAVYLGVRLFDFKEKIFG